MFDWCLHVHEFSVLPSRIIQGMTGRHGLGVACGHIKAFGLFPYPHQRKICAEGLQGQHASHVSMLGRTLDRIDVKEISILKIM